VQSDDDEQLIPRMVMSVVGGAATVHVTPASLDRTSTPGPPATHSDVVGQDRASRVGRPDGVGTDVHVEPPLVLVDRAPCPLPLAPAAKQELDVTHATALNPATPVADPPAIGMAGA